MNEARDGGDVILESLPPHRCEKNAIDVFETLVRDGGEVAGAGLCGRIKNAHALVFARDGSDVIGVGALKKPVATYRDGVFRKAALAGSGALYEREVGWLFVIAPRRGEGLGRLLTKACVDATSGRSVYATSSAKNTRMHGLLEETGFCRAGQPYPSDQDDDTLVLFVRPQTDLGK